MTHSRGSASVVTATIKVNGDGQIWLRATRKPVNRSSLKFASDQ